MKESFLVRIRETDEEVVISRADFDGALHEILDPEVLAVVAPFIQGS